MDVYNFNDMMVDYATKKYGEKLAEFHESFIDEFPYNIEGLDKQTYFKNFMDWLIYEKMLPHSGKTIVDEYIDEHPDMDENTKNNLKGTMKFISSEFIVLSKQGASLVIKDAKVGERYNAIFQQNIPGIGRNTLLIGRIHPFGETYLFAGAFGIYNSPMILDPDVMMSSFMECKIKDSEGIIITEHTQLTAVLNKYPCNWVDGICLSLGLSEKGKKNEKAKMIQEYIIFNIKDVIGKLPQKSKDVLKIVLNQNGIVKYDKLKGFSDEISFFWESEMPTSDIGVLRVKGLLVIGKNVDGGRKYKCALIPSDIRDAVRTILVQQRGLQTNIL